jgi:hypothetical protein
MVQFMFSNSQMASPSATLGGQAQPALSGSAALNSAIPPEPHCPAPLCSAEAVAARATAQASTLTRRLRFIEPVPLLANDPALFLLVGSDGSGLGVLLQMN